MIKHDQMVICWACSGKVKMDSLGSFDDRRIAMHSSKMIRRLVTTVALALMIPVHTAIAAEEDATIPSVLGSMQEHAEQIVGRLLATDGPASREQYQQLRLGVNRLHQLITSDPSNDRHSRELIMIYSWMRVIDIEITDKSWVEAAIAANQLSGMIIQALDFPTMTQRDVAWMDYLAREMELLTLEDPVANADLLSVRLLTLENTWGRVREVLIQHFKNKPLLLQGDTLVIKLKASTTPAETVALAKQLLDFIDLVEKAE